MIYIIVGPSCAGKTSFIMNTWLKGKQRKDLNDLMMLCETDEAFLLGNWSAEVRSKWLDRISRKQISLIPEQVKRLIGKGKDIVLDGDKAVGQKIFEELLATKEKCQLYWIKCSAEESIRRNRVNGSTLKDGRIKAVATKAENIFWKFAPDMRGGIILTENPPVWNEFSLETSNPYYPYDTKGKKMRDDFAVFILTHGRADNVVTLPAIKKAGYTGKIYFIIDDEDDQAEKYRENFGADNVVVFDKQAAYDRADTMDNFNDHRAIIYARNECWRIAKELGLNYFLMLDDDYQSIVYRYEEKGKLKARRGHEFDRVFEDMIQFLEASGADTVAFCQGGDFIGGIDGGNFRKGLLRKAMNSFFCKTDTPIEFRGTMNEDVVTYTTLSSRGHLFFSYTDFCVIQLATQSLAGGMTDAYKEGGTYLKSFYAVMSMPSSVKLAMMRTKHKRIHHNVNWEHTAPKILNEKWRKEREKKE